MEEQCGAVRRSSGDADAATCGGGRKTTADGWAPGGSDTGRSEGPAGWSGPRGRQSAQMGREEKERGRERELGRLGWVSSQAKLCSLFVFFLLKSNQGSNSNRIYSKTWRSLTRLV